MLSPMMQCAGRIRVKGCPFGAPDGVSSSFQLADRHGHAVTKDVRIQSIHQTDWQGRVELSEQPRTNLALHSGDMSQWQAANGTSAASASTAPDGTVSMCRLTGNGATGSQALHLGTSLGVGVTALSCVFVRRDQNRYAKILGFGNGAAGCGFDLQTGESQVNGDWDDCGCILLDATYALIWGIVTPLSSDEAWYGLASNLNGSNPTTPGAELDFWGAMVIPGVTIPGAYIPTTDSPVTVTDYTHDGQGGITTGQVPGATASLDWTGTARRTA